MSKPIYKPTFTKKFSVSLIRIVQVVFHEPTLDMRIYSFDKGSCEDYFDEKNVFSLLETYLVNHKTET